MARDAEPPAATAARLRALLEDLGGTFVKFGQMLALQPDIVPHAAADELLNLLDRIAPVPFADVAATLERELGGAAQKIEHLDPVPVATASIGQVHVGTVDGRRVAVKVQRPGIEAQIRADVRLMRLAIHVIQRCHLRALYWLIEPTLEFAAWTDDELDFRLEARNMRHLGRQSAGRTGARVPSVFDELVTRRVLVAEFLDGASVAQWLRARREGTPAPTSAPAFDPGRFARHVAENFVRDALVHGHFHADLHPANLLVLPDSAVGYVDFGIIGGLSVYARRQLGLLTMAFLQGDLDEMHRAFMKVVVPRHDADPRAFRAGLDELAPKWYGAGGEGRLQARITMVMFDMLTLSRRTALLPEREVTRYIRSAITVDGLIRRFAPGIDIGRELERACAATVEARASRELGAALWAGAMRATDYVAQMRDQGVSMLAALDAQRRENLRAVQLGGAALVSAMVVAWSPETHSVGVNVTTAGLAVLASATALLARLVVRGADA